MDWRKILCCLVVGIPGVAAAAEAETAAQGEVWLAALDTITVTATGNPIEAFVYPGMVTVVGRDQIRQRQASALGDVLRWVPGVEFTGGPRRSGQTPSIRGFSGADVIVTLDGARQNFLSAHDGRVFIDPSLLREVEVLRGAASSLYGSGGNGGVIALRTIRASDFLAPGERIGGHVGAAYHGVNDEYAEMASVYGRPAQGLDLLAAVTKRDSGEIELGDGSTLLPADDDILSGLGKASWAFGDGQRLEASYLHFNNQAEEPNNGQGRGGDNLVQKDIEANNWRLAYELHPEDKDWLNLEATLYRNVTDLEERRLDGNGNGPVGELLVREIETTGLRLQNSSVVTSGGLVLTYGVEAYRDQQSGAAGNGERGGVPDAETEFMAAFAQAQWRWERPFGAPGAALIVPGVRVDDYQASSPIAADNEDQAVSPRLGISYLPSDWSMLFVTYGEAFRAPTVGELYLTGVHFAIPGFGVNRFVPNPGLDPQRTATIEFGGGVDLSGIFTAGDMLQLKLSQFFIEGKDFIDLAVTQPVPPACMPPNCNGTTTVTNVADAELEGTEAEAAYLAGPFRLGLGFSRIDGENKRTGEPLGVLTPAQTTLDVSWRFTGWNTLVGWRVLVADRFDETQDPDEERAGYAVHDFYLVWAPQSGWLSRLRVDFGVHNVFDKDYARVFTGALEPGRDVFTRLTYRFQ